MADHYFSRQPESKSEGAWTKPFSQVKFPFKTDSGSFRKRGSILGAPLLIETAEIEPANVVLDLGCGYGAIGSVIASLSRFPGVQVTIGRM